MCLRGHSTKRAQKSWTEVFLTWGEVAGAVSVLEGCPERSLLKREPGYPPKNTWRRDLLTLCPF